MHNLLSRTKYSRFHGTNVPRDFGEAPSYMLENWCWMPEVLKQLGGHYTALHPRYLDHWRAEHPGMPDPPKEIPDEPLYRLAKSRSLNQTQWVVRQLQVPLPPISSTTEPKGSS